MRMSISLNREKISFKFRETLFLKRKFFFCLRKFSAKNICLQNIKPVNNLLAEKCAGGGDGDDGAVHLLQLLSHLIQLHYQFLQQRLLLSVWQRRQQWQSSPPASAAQSPHSAALSVPATEVIINHVAEATAMTEQSTCFSCSVTSFSCTISSCNRGYY